MEQKRECGLRGTTAFFDDGGNLRVEEESAKFLRKVFASAHVNALLGSGFSGSMVPVLQGRESWFQTVDERMRDCSENKKDTWLTVRSLLRAEYFKTIMHPLREADATDRAPAGLLHSERVRRRRTRCACRSTRLSLRTSP